MHNLICSMALVASSGSMLLNVNFTMIVIAAVAQLLLGSLWYGLVFRKSWRTLAGIPEGQKLKEMVFPMIVFFIACLLLSFVLADLMAMAPNVVKPMFTAGAKIGVICWVGFIAPVLVTQHIWERRRVNLFAINAGYWLLAMALAGGLLAAIR